MSGVELHQLSADQYHADQVTDRPTLSASIAHLLITSSPAHARTAHPRLNPAFKREEEQKFDLGRAAHSFLLEGENAVQVIDGFKDWKTAAAKEARELARAHGRIPMLADQWADCEAMCVAVRAQLDALPIRPVLLTNGLPEQTLVWEEDGVWCRARLDWLRDDHAAVDDLKTTSRSANPESWSRNLYGNGCDVQAAFYLRGLKTLGLEPEWRWIVAETYPPYALSVVSPGPDVLALANAKVDYALGVWKDCLERDSWPAYPTRVCFAELPAYEESRWLAREAREEMAA